jgi:hypothetical protein
MSQIREKTIQNKRFKRTNLSNREKAKRSKIMKEEKGHSKENLLYSSKRNKNNKKSLDAVKADYLVFEEETITRKDKRLKCLYFENVNIDNPINDNEVKTISFLYCYTKDEKLESKQNNNIKEYGQKINNEQKSNDLKNIDTSEKSDLDLEKIDEKEFFLNKKRAIKTNEKFHYKILRKTEDEDTILIKKSPINKDDIYENSCSKINKERDDMKKKLNILKKRDKNKIETDEDSEKRRETLKERNKNFEKKVKKISKEKEKEKNTNNIFNYFKNPEKNKHENPLNINITPLVEEVKKIENNQSNLIANIENEPFTDKLIERLSRDFENEKINKIKQVDYNKEKQCTIDVQDLTEYVGEDKALNENKSIY